MSKRIIYQCDRCLKTREQAEQPVDWCSITASYPHPLSGGYQRKEECKLWCEDCWRQIKQPIPQAVAA